MFDRGSSSQTPPDGFPPAPHSSDPNSQNGLGFYSENYQCRPDFQQNYPRNFQQDYQQNFQQNFQQNQDYPQNHPQTSHFQHQFSQGFLPSEQHGLNFYQEQNHEPRPSFVQQQTGHDHHHFHRTQHEHLQFHQTQHDPHQFHQTQPHEETVKNREDTQTSTQAVSPNKKKRGRPSKKEPLDEQEAEKKKKQRNLNRFDGLSVEEVMSRTLPDVIEHNLDILIIGINPGLMSAYKGHHYPNPGNHFWKCLFLSGLTEKQLNYLHDHTLPQLYSIGFTNMVERTTPGSKDLSSKEIREGGRQLLDKLQKYRPLIAAFNGKGIYEIFCKETFGVKAKNLEFGLQPYKIPQTDTVCFLMPSSSPRCAQFPRAQDKVHFYIKLKELRDRLKGTETRRDVQETQYSFDLQLAKEDAKRLAIKEEQNDPEYESCAGLSREHNP